MLFHFFFFFFFFFFNDTATTEIYTLSLHDALPIDLGFDENVEDARRLHAMLDAVDSCPTPLVARVQGFALGGGSGLVACADVVVAAPDATFGFTEVRLGIIPAVISPFVFAKIGAGAARRLFLTGERFDAETALRIDRKSTRLNSSH